MFERFYLREAETTLARKMKKEDKSRFKAACHESRILHAAASFCRAFLPLHFVASCCESEFC